MLLWENKCDLMGKRMDFKAYGKLNVILWEKNVMRSKLPYTIAVFKGYIVKLLVNGIILILLIYCLLFVSKRIKTLADCELFGGRIVVLAYWPDIVINAHSFRPFDGYCGDVIIYEKLMWPEYSIFIRHCKLFIGCFIIKFHCFCIRF